MDSILKKVLLPYSIIEEFDKIEFEGKKYNCIKNKELYLETIYGKDYMTPPPESKRHIHIAKTIDFNKSYKEYLKKEGIIKCKH